MRSIFHQLNSYNIFTNFSFVIGGTLRVKLPQVDGMGVKLGWGRGGGGRSRLILFSLLKSSNLSWYNEGNEMLAYIIVCEPRQILAHLRIRNLENHDWVLRINMFKWTICIMRSSVGIEAYSGRGSLENWLRKMARRSLNCGKLASDFISHRLCKVLMEIVRHT